MAMQSSRNDECHVLIGVTGSVAAIKLPLIVEKLRNLVSTKEQLIDIKIVVTENAKHFFDWMQVTALDVTIYEDKDEWTNWKKMSDPVVHIELRRWADVMVIAPLDANTLAKVGCGICDNLLTCVVRAWDMAKPLIFCPAMNTMMYNHPLTDESIKKLEQFGYLHIPVVSKRLACGDEGPGAMAGVDEIVERVAIEIDLWKASKDRAAVDVFNN